MIYITPGFNKGIGLEVLIKSLALLNEEQKKNICLICSQQLINEYPLGIHGYILNSINIKTTEKSGCESYLNYACKKLKENDILITLPTIKESFKNSQINGHTDYFRYIFKNKNIAMVFKYNDLNILLNSDHIPLKEVPHTFEETKLFEKISLTLDYYKKYFSALKNVFISGLNPHFGENGRLGNEEKKINNLIPILKEKYPQVNFYGLFSGDSMINSVKNDEENLLVYAYHDQGLGVFKAKYKFYGANITLGLPFLRISPDFGTASDLYGKNKAFYLSFYKLLLMAININQNE